MSSTSPGSVSAEDMVDGAADLRASTRRHKLVRSLARTFRAKPQGPCPPDCMNVVEFPETDAVCLPKFFGEGAQSIPDRFMLGNVTAPNRLRTATT